MEYLILLPTSEGKKKGGYEDKPFRIVQNIKKSNYFINLRSDREYLYDELRKAISDLDEKELEKIFELKGKNLQEAIEILLDLLNEETLEAINRFDGVMFKSINFESLSLEQKKNLNENIVFVDSLFGLLKPSDLIPEYKLKINSKFYDILVSKFWNERLKSYFENLFREKIIIDFLPKEHRKIISAKENAKNYYEISFCELKSGEPSNVGHNSKKLKGEFINYLLLKKGLDLDYIKSFVHSEGYKFSEEFSKREELIFLKE